MKQNKNTLPFFVTPMLSNFAVLQREEVIAVRGGGEAGMEFFVELLKEEENTGRKTRLDSKWGVVEDDGTWQMKFEPLTAGGPYTFSFTTEIQKLSFSHIYMGDVWLLSGQSNMQLSMERVKYRFPTEYREGSSSLIRQFRVSVGWNFASEEGELDGGSWVMAEPGSVSQFSAVGFFFAQKLFERYRVPIGLILTAVGGTPVEAWMSREALNDFPEDLKLAYAYRNPNHVARQLERDYSRIDSWWKKLNQTDKGLKERWFEAVPDGLWKKLSLNQLWEEIPELMGTGSVWLRTRIEISADRVGKRVRLSLGTITDADFTYVNGRLVGSTSYQYPPREYELSSLLPGEQSIVLRVVAVHGQGGFTRGKEHALIWSDGVRQDISEHWEYRLGAVMEPLMEQTFFERKPLGMYQKMIAPLHFFPIRGVCWYQGEMNADNEKAYSAYFERMIIDWRGKWGKKRLPVLFVQLPNYMEKGSENWMQFRDIQRTLAEAPNTGMVVTIDCGEINDLHPTDKKTVGERLAMAAFQIAYGDSGTWLSPLFALAEWRGKELLLHFNYAENGLDTSDRKEVRGFCAEGVSKTIPIHLSIKENTVVVSFPFGQQETLTTIRYAWSNNPMEANLCNRLGLPASPFLYRC